MSAPRQRSREAEASSDALRAFFSSTNVILFGMSGSGKTTLVEHLQRHVPIRYVSLGAITRSEIQEDPDGEVAQLVRNGGKWPLEAVTRLVEPYLLSGSPMILDGVPRYPDEAAWLAERLQQSDFPTALLTLDIDPEIAHARRAQRDNSVRPETAAQFLERVAVYREHHERVVGMLAPVACGHVRLDLSGLNPDAAVSSLAGNITKEV